MPDIQIERQHNLGMERAREVARQWVSQAERDYGLSCTYEESAEAGDCDRVHFTGAGASGTVEVTPERFGMNVQLGFLLGSFSDMIEAKVSRNLDELLAAEPPRAA